MARPKPPIAIIIPIEIYVASLLVYIGDPELMKRWVTKTYKLSEKDVKLITKTKFEQCAGMAVHLDDSRYLLWMPSFDHTPSDFSVLMHEIFHITSYVMRGVHIKHTDKTEEAYAYLYGLIVLKLLKDLKIK